MTSSLPRVAAPRKPRTNEQRSFEMRAALIEACMHCLVELGYAATTTDAICRRASATSGAMRHHFVSKDELMLATMNALHEEMTERLMSLAVVSGSLQQRCRILVQELWEKFYATDRYMAVWEIAIGSKNDPIFREKVLDQRLETSKLYEKIWRDTFQIEEGDVARIEALHVLTSFLRGLLTYHRRDLPTIKAQLSIMAGLLEHMLSLPALKTSGD